MANLLGQIVRKLRIYTPARTLKIRLDRLNPAFARHQRQMTAFYAQFVGPGSLVFDIGANLGNRSEIFLGLGARVIAVEPQPICHEVLKGLFGHDRRFTLVPMALGDTPGSATMYLADMSGLSTLSEDWIRKTKTSGRFAAHDWKQTVTVPVTTLDALVAEHGSPDFCKIDVEGYEPNVLSGLSRSIRAVSFELVAETSENAARCIAHMESLGRYEYNSSKSESMSLERAQWVSGAEMKEIVRTKLHPSYFGDVYARLA
ncbi:MAG: FkbM family methyltransferase [Candidatus Eisenbacteria bacterium]|uniref:FkbM family methyltransferase n=1 Tax=Eiseniibacteriota bacterium TaxID=2212470 RepID=A0A538UAF5_UNCEI|nr:MAG: FkbM family methyltransferase [Candidatus Eisenbacteria bacterium]